MFKQFAILSFPLALASCTTADPQFCTPVQHDVSFGPNSTIKNSSNFGNGNSEDDFKDLSASLANRAGEYVITLSVGGKSIEAVADSGSSNLVLNGAPSLCSNCSASGATGYLPGASGRSLGNPFSIAYGSGRVSGIVYSDTVGLTCGDVLESFPFDVITQNQGSNEPGKAPVPNVFGFAYPALAGNTATFMDQLVGKANDNIEDVISVTLCGTKGGQITIGGLDTRVDSNGIRYTPVVEKSWFTIKTKGMSIGGQPISASFDGVQTILDTGTTLNLVPQAVYSALVAKLRSAGTSLPDKFWTANGDPTQNEYVMQVSASDLAKLPVISLTFPNADGGADISVDLKPEVYLKSLGNAGRIFSFRPAAGSPYIWGQPVLESMHVVFKRGEGKVGFAPNNFSGGC